MYKVILKVDNKFKRCMKKSGQLLKTHILQSNLESVEACKCVKNYTVDNINEIILICTKFI